MYDKDNEILITKEGFERVEKDLEMLKVVKRKEISERIKIAREFGDLSENAEYDEAKNAQAENEIEIEKLERIIKFAKIVDEKEIPENLAFVGRKVKVLDMDTKEEEVYELVGARDADPFENKVSNSSPIGKAILGKQVGDELKIEIPSGELNYKILDIYK